MFFESPFQSLTSKAQVPEGTEVIFVSDLFRNDYCGGAELTSDALIQSSPYKIACVKSKDVTLELLEKHVKLFWIFGNFTHMDPHLIPSIVANIRYAIVEYDYKYCKYRSSEKHLETEGKACNCHNEPQGKLVSAFYYSAESLFWMSEAQRDRYFSLFPFLKEKKNIVLSSVFDNKTLDALTMPKSLLAPANTWIILGSNSWVKGFAAAEQWCKENNKQYEIVWNVPYEELINKFAFSEGFVYLPVGADTCPRMVIEAKISGCKLVLNENVQHAKEKWFDTDDISSIVDYLRSRPEVFWNSLKRFVENKPTISGYTTTRNCILQKYPFEQCIRSMLGFCDEVVVVDGGSVDGTWNVLEELAAEDSRVKIRLIERNWSDERFAVFDGLQKAEARKLCTGDFCWQMDSDEIVHEDHYSKIREFVQMFPKGVDLIALPVVEYWGGADKVRIDVNPWKWRLSRNTPNITHGIPKNLRKFDENGKLCAMQGTDGCDMIDATTFEPISHVSFYTHEAHGARMAALNGSVEGMLAFQSWFNNVVENIPGVFHFSWFDLERKIHTYKNYWTSHWESLMGEKYSDTSESNMFFDLPWSEVTDEMIQEKAKELQKIGGWIWHKKWRGQKTPWLTMKKQMPKLMIDYYAKNAA